MKIRSVSVGDQLRNHANMPYTVTDVRGFLVNVKGTRSNSASKCFTLDNIKETFSMEKKFMAKKTKRTRRSPAQVDQAVKKIKELIAGGMSVNNACKEAKMQPQMYYKYKDRAFPEKKSKPGKKYTGSIKSYTRDEILNKLNSQIDSIDARIKELTFEMERAIDSRDTVIKALGL